LVGRDGRPVEGDAVATAAQWLADGKVVAIKGIGGFHLACRADDEAAVRRLRCSKARDGKPFAVMAASLTQARGLVQLDGEAEQLLRGPDRPIVVLPRAVGAAVANSVAPQTDTLGVMLAYAPVHHLLFGADLPELVMTSGNPGS